MSSRLKIAAVFSLQSQLAESKKVKYPPILSFAKLSHYTNTHPKILIQENPKPPINICCPELHVMSMNNNNQRHNNENNNNNNNISNTTITKLASRSLRLPPAVEDHHQQKTTFVGSLHAALLPILHFAAFFSRLNICPALGAPTGVRMILTLPMGLRNRAFSSHFFQKCVKKEKRTFFWMGVPFLTNQIFQRFVDLCVASFLGHERKLF